MRSIIRHFATDESGATVVEYAVLAGIIALGIIVSVGAIRDSLNGMLNSASSHLQQPD
jgi:pilus assembly protein Flp/PilA